MESRSRTVDVLLAEENVSHWRLYVAPPSRIGVLRDRSGPTGVIFPVRPPDLDDLEQWMWEADAPYEKHPTRDGRAVQLVARGRSAETLLRWLDRFLAEVPRSAVAPPRP